MVTRRRAKCCSDENILLIATVIGVAAGIGVGLAINLTMPTVNGYKVTPRTLIWIRLPGELFLRALKMLILPLIVSSLVNALVKQNPESAGKMGMYASLYYLTTTVIAVILGMIIVSVIQPGKNFDQSKLPKDDSRCGADSKPTDTLIDLMLNMVPDNLVQATFQSTSSCAEYVMMQTQSDGSFKHKVLSAEAYEALNGTNMTEKGVYVEPIIKSKNGMNVLGLVILSLAAGCFIVKVGKPAEPLARLFDAVESVTMAAVTAVIWFSPIGIAFLVAAAIIGMGNLAESFAALGLYVVTVLSGLLLHACVVLPLLLLLVGRRNPLKYSFGLIQAYLTAFGTSSSSATMPTTMKCLEDNNNVHPQVVRMVIPLGATINMDGTALYEAVAAIYILQATGQTPGFQQLLLTSITATLASVGAAGIPQAGLVTMIMVLISINVDPSLVALILPVDWFLDRIRTTVNVHGDAYGAAIVQRLCQRTGKLGEEPVGTAQHRRRIDTAPPDDEMADRAAEAGKVDPFESSLVGGHYYSTEQPTFRSFDSSTPSLQSHSNQLLTAADPSVSQLANGAPAKRTPPPVAPKPARRSSDPDSAGQPATSVPVETASRPKSHSHVEVASPQPLDVCTIESEIVDVDDSMISSTDLPDDSKLSSTKPESSKHSPDSGHSSQRWSSTLETATPDQKRKKREGRDKYRRHTQSGGIGEHITTIAVHY